MSHRLREREIFALLDGTLSVKAKAALDHHLQECALCRQHCVKLRALKRAAAASFVTMDQEPRWERIDRAVEVAIREVTAAAAPPRSRLMPVALAFAAAAAIAFALWVPWPALGPNEAEIARTRAVQTVRPPQRTIPPTEVATTVREAWSPATGFARSTTQFAVGATVLTAACSATSLALGPDATVDLGGGAALQLNSLDEDFPALELLTGRVQIAVPPHAFIHGVHVAAAGTSFRLSDAIAAFSYDGVAVDVVVLMGEVSVFDGATPVGLANGRWRIVPASGEGPDGALIVISPLTTPAQDTETAARPLEERVPAGVVRGILPRRLAEEAAAAATPRLRECYEQALKRDPVLTLSTLAQLQVGVDGKVASVRIADMTHPGLRACVVKALKETTFPKPLGGPVDLILPLRLSPSR